MDVSIEIEGFFELKIIPDNLIPERPINISLTLLKHSSYNNVDCGQANTIKYLSHVRLTVSLDRDKNGKHCMYCTFSKTKLPL